MTTSPGRVPEYFSAWQFFCFAVVVHPPTLSLSPLVVATQYYSPTSSSSTKQSICITIPIRANCTKPCHSTVTVRCDSIQCLCCCCCRWWLCCSCSVLLSSKLLSQLNSVTAPFRTPRFPRFANRTSKSASLAFSF